MAGHAAAPLLLDRGLRRQVERWSRSAKLPHRIVVRAKIIALACAGRSNAEIAREVGIVEETARKWRERMRRLRKVTALNDEPRAGRPARVPIEVRCEVIKIACDRPPKDKTPFRDIWTIGTLRDRAAEATGYRLSKTEIRRILRCENLRPHHVRQWLHSPDPDFARRTREVCSIYVNPPEGATVVCVDEKPGMQALERIHPTHYSRVGQAVRYEFEYKRHGTTSPPSTSAAARCSASVVAARRRGSWPS
jgi:transposase